MQNNVKTPSDRITFDKRIHTPPSVESDTGRPKLLKSISGTVFRRPSLKSSQNSTLDSIELFAAGGSMSKRRLTPKPLNLTHPLSPPPTVRKKREVSPRTGSTGSLRSLKLDSPIHMLSPAKYRSCKSSGIKPTNLRESLKHEALRSASSSATYPIIWTDTVEDPYLEENSPTYFRSISRNVSNITSSAGRRRFITEQCSMCAEGMSSIFPGETVVQMTCSHASHYECYLAMYEPVYMSGEWPECRECHKLSKPIDPEVIQRMTSSLLTKRDSTTSLIEQHLMQDRLHGSVISNTFDFTPKDQLITSADFSSDGFKTPLRMTRTIPNYENDDTALSYGTLFGQVAVFEDKLVASLEENDLLSENDATEDLTEKELEDEELHIEIKPLTDSHMNKRYFVVAEVPNEQHHNHCVKHNSKHKNHIASEKKILKSQIESFVKRELNQGAEVGFLSMFDQVGYSTDGENWHNTTLVCFFEKCLILFDVSEMKTVGKIPVEQICHVNKLNENSLIIDLKSRALPEVYFSFPLVQDHESTLERWKYYLVQPDKEADLEHMTETAWDILPPEITPSFTECSFNDSSFECDKCTKPWQSQDADAPLQLIVCLSLSNNERHDSAAYEHRIAQGLRRILECLNEGDLFGLVTVGKNGSGDIGEFGSFVGTVNKNWTGWDDFIDSLQIVECQAFQTPLKEFNKVWETCYRLVSTSYSLLDSEEHAKFFKQIVFMTDDPQVQGTNKYEEIITKDYHFELMRVPSYHTKNCDFADIISGLHKKSVKALEIKLPGGVLQFGNMAPGERKTLTAHLDELPLSRKKGVPVLLGAKRSVKNASVEIEAQWYSLKTASQRKIRKSLRIPICRS
ncbi:FAR1 (YJL157C) [Zygosaccharomyces parabailii]|nr:FAR1 (YJL157C) [Zygosaccharomyces parabailii]